MPVKQEPPISRKHDLENHIRESWDLIREYETIVRLSSDPKEKLRAQKNVREQKALVEGYWAEYRTSFGDAEADKLVQEIPQEPAVSLEPQSPVTGRGQVYQQFGGQQTNISVQFDQVHGGTINVGGGSTPAEPIASAKPEVDWPTLLRMMERVKDQVRQDSPPEKRQEALDEIQRLHEAILQDHPDQQTLNSVTSWFLKHMPAMGNAVNEFVSFVYRQFW